MKKGIIFLVSICLVLELSAQQIIAGTFNLRYDNPRDTGNLWKDRAPVAAALVRFHQFDIVGTQEGLRNQLDDLQLCFVVFPLPWLPSGDGQIREEEFYLTETTLLHNHAEVLRYSP